MSVSARQIGFGKLATRFYKENNIMEKNANINARLIDLLNILDMRAHINVFGYDPDGKQIVIFNGMPVYEVITRINARKSEDRELRNYEVTAINAGLVTNILIEEGR